MYEGIIKQLTPQRETRDRKRKRVLTDKSYCFVLILENNIKVHDTFYFIFG